MKNNLVKKMVIFSLSASILIIQKWLLSFIPNFQFTTVLIIIFFYVYGFKPTMIIVFLYVLLDNLCLGTMNIIYTPVMIIGWMLLVIIIKICHCQAKQIWKIGIIGAVHAIIYSMLFVGASAIFYHINILVYLIQDIPYTLLLMGSNFLTIIWLFKPLQIVLVNNYQRIMVENACEKGQKML